LPAYFTQKSIIGKKYFSGNPPLPIRQAGYPLFGLRPKRGIPPFTKGRESGVRLGGNGLNLV